MGLFDKIKSPFVKNIQQEKLEDNPDYIKAYDEFGRELYITKDQWRKNVLPNQLQKDWDNPDHLYSDIVTAMQDGFFKDIIEASKRLILIDSDKERSTTVRGIVLMKNGRLDEAERIFNNFLEMNGESGVVLTNLAKVLYEKNNVKESENVLRHAVEIDPNQDNALGWLMAIENEKGGHEAVVKTLIEYAKINTSWRPQLWLGRYALEDKDIIQAKEYYKCVLSRSEYNPDAMMMISGDLGKNEYLDEIIELVTPHYVPSKHGPLCGFNLLETYIRKKDWEKGFELIHQIRMENWVPFNERLIEYSNVFDQIKKEQQIFEDVDITQEHPTAIILDRPIWLYGLEDPKWLYIKKRDDAVRIILLPLSKTTNYYGRKPYVNQEDDIGRISRGLPLLLSEKLYFCSESIPMTYILGFKEGVILYGKELEWDFLASLSNTNADVFVTGEIITAEKEYEIKLHLWDAHKKQKVTSLSEKSLQDNISDALYSIASRFESEMKKNFKVNDSNAQAYYTFPTKGLFLNYIYGLAQSLTLSLLENNFGRKEDLWGERNIYQWFLSLILADEKNVVPKIMFASSLTKGLNFGSLIPKEFETKVETILNKENDHSSCFYLLSPLLHKVFQKKSDIQQEAVHHSGINEKEYQEWLESVAKK